MAKSDLTVGCNSQESLTRDAPRPTAAWLTARVTALLSHYYQPEVSDEADMMMVADWIDALGDLPQEAVERAIRERIQSAERARPLPGEIRQRALAFLPPARDGQISRAAPPPLTEEQIAERQERNLKTLRKLAAEFPDLLCPDGSPRALHLKRVPASEADE